MNAPPSLDFARLQAAYASRAATPSAVVRQVLARIEASQPVHRAWIYVAPREALLARAAELERRRAAGELLPLYGMPYAVKDNIDVASQPTTAACPAFAYVPNAHAHAVQRLEEAGAICIGKTNMDQFATGLVGTRSPFGACANPFDPAYISGGSSAGSAVAVALGHVAFALGTDTAGSGRVPAGFCNVVGLKPTRGAVSTRGVVPACRSLDCISIFALTVQDAWAVYEQVRHFDDVDAYSRQMADAPPGPGPLRCGVPQARELQFFGDATARAAFDRALALLRQAGAELVEIDYAPFAEAARLLYEGPWVAERFAAIKAFFAAGAEQMHPVVRGIVESGRRYSAVEAFECQYRLADLKRACEAQWRRMDVLALPTAGTIYRIADVEAAPVALNTNLGYYTNFVNLLDLAALAVPAPFRSDGLPFGITFVGRAGQDAELARWGGLFHRIAGTALGATGIAQPACGEDAASAPADSAVLAVVGAHLSGLPLNGQLTSRGARLLESCTTAPHYRLYALPDTSPPRPGLVRVAASEGKAIDVELWEVPLAQVGAFVADVPPPLAIGTIELADGRDVKGFLCEGYAVRVARDISDFGGWRAYLASRTPAKTR